MNLIVEILLRSIITATVAVILGFGLYYFMYYRVTNRGEIKDLVLEYLEFANLNYDTPDRNRFRTILIDKNEIKTVDSNPVYPSIKAIMQWTLCNLELQRGIKYGFKYDEAFFYNILGELMMEGRVTAIHDEATDEMVGFKFQSYNV